MKTSLLILAFIFSGIVLSHCQSSNGTPEENPLLNVSDLTIEEGSTSKDIFVTITLSKPSVDTVLVFVSTIDSTAVAGEDFVGFSEELILFTPGDLREDLKVTIKGDLIFEGDESFTLDFFSPVNVDLRVPSITITLQNDDVDNTLRIPTSGYSTPAVYDGMTLLWADEFEGDALNTTDWTYETGGGGWGNNELQYYRKENTSIIDGNVVIEARKETFGGRLYTSSRLITKDKIEFLYGRVDIRAALPFGQGIWPALWMLGANISEVGWPKCGEIDIMEKIGGANRENTIHGTPHWYATSDHAQYGGSYTLKEGSVTDEYHVYSIIWTASSIKWLIDDFQYHSIDITPAELDEFRKPQFIIFNVAVGGNWPGNPNESTLLPQRMIVDYIRVFQNN